MLDRLLDSEDSFTERKPESVNDRELRKTLVAFANSAPMDRAGLLFIGVSDNGSILGVSDTDRIQKKIRKIAEGDCFPPISYTSEVLTKDGKKIVAVAARPTPLWGGRASLEDHGEEYEAGASTVEQDHNDLKTFLREHSTSRDRMEGLNRFAVHWGNRRVISGK